MEILQMRSLRGALEKVSENLRMLCGLALLRVAAAHPAGIQEAEIAERRDQHNHPNRETDIAVGDCEVRIVPAGNAVNQQCHDAEKRSRKKRCKTRRHSHQKRRKPAKIAKRNAEEDAFAARARNIVNTFHLK